MTTPQSTKPSVGESNRAMKNAVKRFHIYRLREQRMEDARRSLYGGSWLQMSVGEILHLFYRREASQKPDHPFRLQKQR